MKVRINTSCPRCQTPLSASANVADELIIFDEPNAMHIMPGPMRTRAMVAMKVGGMKHTEIGAFFDISGSLVGRIIKNELKKRGEP